ncbi:MAG: heparan-alpha-glucosaminide N-acetyltransferase [Faecalibacterium sp.]
MENERRARQKAPAGRYALLDELRGLDLVSMMLYHACWDLVFLFDVNMRWYAGTPGRLWQQTICWVFILLSGFCAPFGRYMLRRGTVVFGAGAVVTLATLVFMPEGRVIFGVLTFLGTAMLLTGVLEPLLKKVMPAVGLGGWKLMLPQSLYANYFTAFFGFYPDWFYSTDYFGLLPWLFLFWAGYYLHKAVGRRRMEPLRRPVCPALGWMGRHSLLLYLLHQPVIYGVLSAAAVLFA